MIGLPDNERDELRITLATGCKDSPAVVRSILLHAAGVIPVSKTIIASFSHTFLTKIRRFWVKSFWPNCGKNSQTYPKIFRLEITSSTNNMY